MNTHLRVAVCTNRLSGEVAESLTALAGQVERGALALVLSGLAPGEVAARAAELALETYRVLGCYGFARVDLMLDDASGELTVLEANVIPGLTDTSLLPLAAEAAGIGFEALIARVLELAVARAPA